MTKASMSTEPAPSSPTRNQIIASISGQLGADHYPTGERAALKRMDAADPGPGAHAAAVRLLLKAGEEQGIRSDIHLARWTLLIHGMALMSGPGRPPHRWEEQDTAGAVMFHTSYSESRLLRLLEARGTTFDALLSRLARFLAAKGTTVNWSDLAPLILEPEGGAKTEKARLNLMRRFIAAERQAESTTSESA